MMGLIGLVALLIWVIDERKELPDDIWSDWRSWETGRRAEELRSNA